jgi:hypothetical protein
MSNFLKFKILFYKFIIKFSLIYLLKMGKELQDVKILTIDPEKKPDHIEFKWKIGFLILFFLLGLINNLG